jgi:Holliday junction resolvase RusA-like endonuclease
MRRWLPCQFSAKKRFTHNLLGKKRPKTSMKILTLTGGVVPKARARVTRNGTFMPHRYRDWKTATIFTFRAQVVALGLAEPLSGVGIEIMLLGKHGRRGDLDNIAGSILDALVQSGVLKDDSLSVVSSLAIALQWSQQPPTVEIRIESVERAAAA